MHRVVKVHVVSQSYWYHEEWYVGRYTMMTSQPTNDAATLFEEEKNHVPLHSPTRLGLEDDIVVLAGG